MDASLIMVVLFVVGLNEQGVMEIPPTSSTTIRLLGPMTSVKKTCQITKSTNRLHTMYVLVPVWVGSSKWFGNC